MWSLNQNLYIMISIDFFSIKFDVFLMKYANQSIANNINREQIVQNGPKNHANKLRISVGLYFFIYMVQQ